MPDEICSGGLGLSQGIGLTIPDIDGQRMVVRVRHGKGGQDRYVPLAERLLALLRTTGGRSDRLDRGFSRIATRPAR